MTMHEVTGKILLDGWGGEPGPATVYVRLLDTSRIDAAARKVAEVVLYDVQLDRVQDDGIEFCLMVGDLDPRAQYEIGVLVDLDGDGRKSKGDYLNMQSYPVITRGHPNQVEVQARRIG
jgi:hypothetical protein